MKKNLLRQQTFPASPVRPLNSIKLIKNPPKFLEFLKYKSEFLPPHRFLSLKHQKTTLSPTETEKTH